MLGRGGYVQDGALERKLPLCINRWREAAFRRGFGLFDVVLL